MQTQALSTDYHQKTDSLKQAIKQIMKSNFLVSEAMKEMILENLPQYTTNELEKIYQLVNNAKTTQQYFIKDAIENNPSFKTESQSIIKQNISTQLKNKEEASKNTDELYLNKLLTNI